MKSAKYHKAMSKICRKSVEMETKDRIFIAFSIKVGCRAVLLRIDGTLATACSFQQSQDGVVCKAVLVIG
jgi:hypothetical protein